MAAEIRALHKRGKNFFEKKQPVFQSFQESPLPVSPFNTKAVPCEN
jgi:hypothetical protein